jgi:four helix bundle protein
MSLKKFRAYQLSIRFYRLCENVKCSRHLKEQLDRASSSITLNLSEGSAKFSVRDRLRFYSYSLGSLRECQSILDLAGIDETSELGQLSDELGAQLFTLCRSLNKQAAAAKMPGQG